MGFGVVDGRRGEVHDDCRAVREERLGSEEFPHLSAHLLKGVSIKVPQRLDAQLPAKGTGLFDGTLEIPQLGMHLLLVLLATGWELGCKRHLLPDAVDLLEGSCMGQALHQGSKVPGSHATMPVPSFSSWGPEHLHDGVLCRACAKPHLVCQLLLRETAELMEVTLRAIGPGAPLQLSQLPRLCFRCPGWDLHGGPLLSPLAPPDSDWLPLMGIDDVQDGNLGELHRNRGEGFPALG